MIVLQKRKAEPSLVSFGFWKSKKVAKIDLTYMLRYI